MEELLTELVKSSPHTVPVLVVMYMMLRHFAAQKTECHQWQEEQNNRYEATANRLDTTLLRTNECLTQCAAAHARQERVFRQMMNDASEHGKDEG